MAVVRRFFDELVNEGDFTAVDEILAPEYVRREAGSDEVMRGPEAFEAFITDARRAFSGMEVTIDEMLVADGAVVVRARERGTHDGEFMSVEPTGERVEVEGIVIHRVDDGRIVETYACWDMLGMMRQLGVVPPTETGAPSKA